MRNLFTKNSVNGLNSVSIVFIQGKIGRNKCFCYGLKGNQSEKDIHRQQAF